MADDRDSLLREVDEELRREQMQKFWERYNGLILGGAALIVAGVAGYKFLESRRIAAAQAAGAEYDAAVTLANDLKSADSLKAFGKIADSGPAGYAALARLNVAGAEAKAGNVAGAVAAYDMLAKNSSADPLIRGFAQLQAASLRMAEADVSEIQTRLQSLLGDSSPFKTSAHELLGLAAFKAGKLADARKELEPLLIDPKASRAIQERVKIVMAQIAAAEAGPAAAPAAAATPTPAPAPAPAAEAAKPADGEKKN